MLCTAGLADGAPTLCCTHMNEPVPLLHPHLHLRPLQLLKRRKAAAAAQAHAAAVQRLGAPEHIPSAADGAAGLQSRLRGRVWLAVDGEARSRERVARHDQQLEKLVWLGLS